MLTYILSFLPLSDQKEASLVSRAWYHAAQNALREVRYLPSPGLFSVVSHFSLLVALFLHHPSIHSCIHIHTLHSYVFGFWYSAGTIQMNKALPYPRGAHSPVKEKDK